MKVSILKCQNPSKLKSPPFLIKQKQIFAVSQTF
ncbi:MAG: hypothetical protein ACI97N_000738, partial [Cognaticolwellia sp.]